MKKTTTANRLKEIMLEHNLRQVDILEKCKPYCLQYNIKLGRNDLSQYVNGKVEPKQDKLTILGLALDVNEAWLMGFDVPKARKNTTTEDIIIEEKQILPKIMEYYTKLNNTGKKEATKRVAELTYFPHYVQEEVSLSEALENVPDTPEELEELFETFDVDDIHVG